MDKEHFKEGFLHIFKAAGYSLAGLKTGLKLSLAFRQELLTFPLHLHRQLETLLRVFLRKWD